MEETAISPESEQNSSFLSSLKSIIRSPFFVPMATIILLLLILFALGIYYLWSKL